MSEYEGRHFFTDYDMLETDLPELYLKLKKENNLGIITSKLGIRFLLQDLCRVLQREHERYERLFRAHQEFIILIAEHSKDFPPEFAQTVDRHWEELIKPVPLDKNEKEDEK